MTDTPPTPDQIKAFLDDLALISVKHGITLTSRESVNFEDRTPAGYSYDPNLCEVLDDVYHGFDDADLIDSLDVSTLSAHQRIALRRPLLPGGAS